MFRAELVYSADLESVLSMLRRSAAEPLTKEQYEFYFACLDRIDILITEKDSTVTKTQVMSIVQALSFFRPKQQKQDEKFGYSDIISVRHRELIAEKKDKYGILPVHMAKHMYQNLTKGILKDMFTDIDA